MRPFLAIAVLVFGVLASASSEADTVLVTGSDRGIGLELVKQYAEMGWTVIATARKPAKAKELKELAAKNSKVAVEKLDVVKEGDIKALAGKYRGKPIDLLINNAGILGDGRTQTLGGFNLATFETVMNVNLYGPLAVSQAFLENVIASKQKKIVTITSGIISATGRPPAYLDSNGYFNLTYYRASKIALDFAMKGISEDIKSKGVLIASVFPGAVDTDMSKSILSEAERSKFVTPAVSASNVIKVIDGLTADTNGKVLSLTGKVMPVTLD